MQPTKTEIRRIRKNRCRNLQKDGENPLVVVLDNIRSMHNVGAAFSELMMLFGGENDSLWHYIWNHLTEKFTKQSIGSKNWKCWLQFDTDNVKRRIIDLKTLGSECCGNWTNDPIQWWLPILKLIKPRKNTALVLGNEVEGFLMKFNDRFRCVSRNSIVGNQTFSQCFWFLVEL